MKKIAMFGICGKMGISMARELIKEKDMDICAGFDIFRVGEDIGTVLGCWPDVGQKSIRQLL